MEAALKETPGHTDPVRWLREEYARRRAKNPSYSLRAFARHLGVGSGPLSEIFAGKRSLSLETARRVADRLLLPPQERKRFLSLVVVPLPDTGDYRLLREDVFAVIADWPHFAILSLLNTKGARADARWIGSRLGIPAAEAQNCLDRLVRLEMVRWEGERLKPVSGWTTTHDIPNEAVRKFHRQVLALARTALDEVAVEQRDITSITVAVDTTNLPRAKALIKKFRRQLAALLEKGDPEEVYQLNIQLIPVTRKGASHA